MPSHMVEENAKQGWDHQSPVPAPIAPSGLLESVNFAEDLLYYHHLRDSSANGLLSTLFLNDVFQAEYLDGAFFPASQALSALSVWISNAPEPVVAKASLHALDHVVTTLGSIRSPQLDDSDIQPAQAKAFVLPQSRYMKIFWLATIIFLACFELQKGQLKLWYIHCRAALAFLSQNLNSVYASAADKSLTPFRPSSLHSAARDLAGREVAGNPQQYTLWRQQAENLIGELNKWRESMPDAEAPLAQDENKGKSSSIVEGSDFSVTPLTLVHD
ncbi:uncharacterized protein ColSpa_11249 [Colletotrichum spaethianum]|uniref:Transcription factor domain-containing protein n=1 Tax=Colletotrichum spaethianum TaxID=700344 RepID=A0AA37PEY9_9PEZI|nr:uncharacterized protein ColSpa_11249 [Colletotrichum spaethianum]GKT51068.1 hypothetical protein ColSpa_11249 [Colletotrichum spaethianum]